MSEMSRRSLLLSGSISVAATVLGARATATVGSAPSDQLPRLGVCYYPEQWPESQWAADAAEMAARGISRVRIAEFAWTLMEPSRGQFDWGWLDRVVDVLGSAGLGVVLGTPTATPPEWLVAELPEILPVSAEGRVKGFGSRRYYTFSSLRYRQECARIASAMAARYGRNAAIVGWQIDNEYGCHDTTYSYGPVDAAGFRQWVAKKYGTVKRLNEAWGAVVWSQQVDAFENIALPIATPYDPSPAKLLDFRRYASEQVAAFHAVQADIIRARSPGRFITTNFMGNFTEFDHYPIGDQIDFASWDSYPLGVAAGRDDPRWDRTGTPDITGWNHDLMRAINPAPFWIMEQQPGPVNWARYNPAPKAGMVRLWTWEAFAHGASTVSYFRWRQGQIGQEQMHAGLNLPDGAISPGGREVVKVAAEIAKLGPLPATRRGDVALVFDFETVWMTQIQPDGADQDHLAHAQNWYGALRALGLNVDVVRPGSDLGAYKLAVIPSIRIVRDDLRGALGRYEGLAVIGPRTGSKTPDFAIPADLPPGPLHGYLPLHVVEVETMRPGQAVAVEGPEISGSAVGWREFLESTLPVLARYSDGGASVLAGKHAWYVGCAGDSRFTQSLMGAATARAGLTTTRLPDTVRFRRRGNVQFAFNYGAKIWHVPEQGKRFLLGSPDIEPYSLAAWQI